MVSIGRSGQPATLKLSNGIGHQLVSKLAGVHLVQEQMRPPVSSEAWADRPPVRQPSRPLASPAGTGSRGLLPSA